jgi:ABC-type antimicrobial peptide transport system permease subunit
MSEQAQELNRSFLPSVSPYSKTIAKARRPIDLAASIASILAGLSLVLALVGVYGVTAYTVTQRTRELGVRIALGARPRSILVMVLRENFVTVAIGVAIGIGGAIFLGRLLTGLLYGVKPADPLALFVGCAILFVTSTLAAWGPASRAARIDPAVTLRHE